MVVPVPVSEGIRLVRKSIVGIIGAGTPPRWKPFLLQLVEWTLAVILSRFICGSVVCLPAHLNMHGSDICLSYNGRELHMSNRHHQGCLNWLLAQVLGCKPILMPAAHVLDVLFSGHPVLLLFFVMIMCPLAMNILQVIIPPSHDGMSLCLRSWNG